MNPNKTLIEALVAAQAEMPAIPLDGTNPHFRSKFSTLLAVLDTVKPVLNKHGILFTQTFGFDAGAGPVLVTTLQKGDEKVQSFAPIPATPDVQKWASAVTYIRRISALAICGCVGDPDADAEDVVRPAPQKRDFSPRPEGTDEVDPVLVRKWAKAFRDALADRNDERLAKGLDDLNGGDPAMYTAVWDALEPKERNSIMDGANRARAERAKIRQAF